MVIKNFKFILFIILYILKEFFKILVDFLFLFSKIVFYKIYYKCKTYLFDFGNILLYYFFLLFSINIYDFILFIYYFNFILVNFYLFYLDLFINCIRRNVTIRKFPLGFIWF